MSLLEIRKHKKKHKPSFTYQDSYKVKSVKTSWRKPQGKQAKVRYGFRGNMRKPSPGFKSPIEVRGLHASGLEVVMVFNIADVEKIDHKKQGALVGAGVGGRKRADILKKCMEKNIKVLNFTKPAEKIAKIEEAVKSRKKAQEEAKKSKEAAKKEKPKKDKKAEEDKKDLADKLTDEEKKEHEDQERNKVLTSKDAVRV